MLSIFVLDIFHTFLFTKQGEMLSFFFSRHFSNINQTFIFFLAISEAIRKLLVWFCQSKTRTYSCHCLLVILMSCFRFFHVHKKISMTLLPGYKTMFDIIHDISATSLLMTCINLSLHMQTHQQHVNPHRQAFVTLMLLSSCCSAYAI